MRHALIAAVATALLIAVSPVPASAEPDSAEEVEKELEERGNELEKVTEKYNGAREDYKKTKKKIEKIEKKLPKLEKEADKSREELSDIAAQAYSSGHGVTEATRVLAESPDSTLKRMTVLGAIDASQASEVSEHAGKVNGLEDDLKNLEELKDEQKDTKSDVKKKKEKIEGEVDELEELQGEYGGGSGGGLDGAPPSPSGKAGDVVDFAYDQVGEPYSYGASGPDSWDCSGLTMGAWQQGGASLPHQASAQREQTANVSSGDLAAGDLVFYYDDLHHVALYVGDGKVVHAPQEGQPVSVAGVNDMPVNSYGRPA